MRDVALVCGADALVGGSFGAIAVGAGLPVWVPVLLSVVVFGGASQFLFVALVTGGGAVVPAVLACLLLNARHLPYGFAIGDALGPGWPRRLAGSHLLVDETVVFALARRDEGRHRTAFWACGIGLFLCWNAGVLAGAYAGTIVPDTDAFGLDAAFPAVLLALIIPALRDTATRRSALAGAVLAVTAAPVLPIGLPVLLALLGLLAGRTVRPGGASVDARRSGGAGRPGGASVRAAGEAGGLEQEQAADTAGEP